MTTENTHPQYDVNSPENLARRERGLEVARSVDGEAAQAVIDSLADISPALGHHIAAFGFGDVYARPGLDPRSRQLVTIGVLTALGGCEPQLRIHIGAALNVGLTREEIVEGSCTPRSTPVSRERSTPPSWPAKSSPSATPPTDRPHRPVSRGLSRSRQRRTCPNR